MLVVNANDEFGEDRDHARNACCIKRIRFEQQTQAQGRDQCTFEGLRICLSDGNHESLRAKTGCKSDQDAVQATRPIQGENAID